MSNLNSNNFQRTMFGLSSIDSTNVNSSDIVCDTLQVTSIATGPTMPLGDDSTNLATTAFVQESAHVTENKFTWSTGLHSGGVLAAVGAPNYDSITISAGSGTIVTNQITRAHQEVTWENLTVVVPNISSSIVHFVSIDISGNPTFQTTRPTMGEMRNQIFLGVAVALDQANVTLVDQEQQFISNPGNLTQDLYEILGFINFSGNVISATAAGAMIKSSGQMAGFGINYFNDNSNPNVLTTGALDTTTDNVFQVRLYTGQNFNPTGPPYLMPNDKWDTGVGTLQTMSVNKYGVGRMYLFASNTIKMQMAQTQYNSMAEAKEQYLFEAFVTEPSIVANGMLIAYVFYKEGCDFTDAGQFFIINAGKFGQPTGSSATGGDLQTAYNNSSQPQIMIDSTLGALQIKGDSITTNVLEIQDDAENELLTIKNGGSVLLGAGCSISFQDDVHIEGSSSGRVCVGRETECGSYQVSVGYRAGFNPGLLASSTNSVCIGNQAGSGLANSANGNNNVLIGPSTGRNLIPINSNRAYNIVAIGNSALSDASCDNGVTAVGTLAAANSGGQYSTYIGYNAGGASGSNGVRAVGLGYQAGYLKLNDHAVCIGDRAGYSNVANSICINASGSSLNTTQAGLYIKPIRETVPINHKMLCLDTDTNEITAIQTDDHGLLSANNIWTGTNQFNSTVSANTIQGTAATSTISLFDNITTGSISIAGNATQSGDINIGRYCENMYLGLQSDANSFIQIGSSDCGDYNAIAENCALTGYTTTSVLGINSSVTIAAVTSGNVDISGEYINIYGVPNNRRFPAAYMINNTAGVNDHYYPIWGNIDDFNLWYTNPQVPIPADISLGTHANASYNNIDDLYAIAPGIRLVIYTLVSQGGNVLLEYWNRTDYWQTIRPSSTNSANSCAVYLLDGTQLT